MIPLVLKVYDGGKLKAARAFRAERIRLGSAGAELLLESPSVAPTHAVIESGALGAVLRATTSAPVYLNGQPILAAPLRHGDLISIGDLRIMVEIHARTSAVGTLKARPRLQLIHGEEEPLVERPHPHVPALQVVREDGPLPLEAATDQGLHEEIADVPPPPPPAPPEPQPAPQQASVAQVSDSAAVAVRPDAPAPLPGTVALPPVTTPLGGECAEVELFWGDTRVSVWQLQPGDNFHAGTAPGCQALLQGIERAPVLRSDLSGWTVTVPRPLQLVLEEEGRMLHGPELLVRGRSQADAHGLVVPLPQHSVAVLSSGSLALRIRRVPGAARVGGEQTDWKGVLVASIAAILMIMGMKFWSAAVPPPKLSSGEPELIKPRPLVVRAAPPKPDHAPVLEAQKVNQARRDPGKAVARHMDQEGAAGSKTAPRREARAERRMDDRALVAQTGLLKALGGGNGQNDVFGIALEKGTRDAMGHLTGPKAGDARGEAGMGLKSLGGRGGGGDGSGLGLARIGTNGIGGGLASYGDGKGGLRGKENGEIGLGPGKPEVVGSIDPELIRKVVHEHRAQIRTCYETQLMSRPNLAGKLVSAWTIDPQGAVTEAHTQETTLRDRTVESCVAARIR
ncbi:MAG: AgmX/PglI C-terminal domain-containing protein, partial [Myxococcales bacterium]